MKKEEKMEEERGERRRKGEEGGVLENKALIKACEVVQIVVPVPH